MLTVILLDTLSIFLGLSRRRSMAIDPHCKKVRGRDGGEKRKRKLFLESSTISRTFHHFQNLQLPPSCRLFYWQHFGSSQTGAQSESPGQGIDTPTGVGGKFWGESGVDRNPQPLGESRDLQVIVLPSCREGTGGTF